MDQIVSLIGNNLYPHRRQNEEALHGDEIDDARLAALEAIDKWRDAVAAGNTPALIKDSLQVLLAREHAIATELGEF